MKHFDLNLKIEKSPSVIFRTIKDVPMVIDYRTGNIIEFDEKEVFIWEHLPNRVSKILNDLPSKYKNSKKIAETLDFLSRLNNKHLISTKDERRRNLSVREVSAAELKVREKIRDLGMQECIPTIAEIELSDQCNLKCVHCYNTTGKGKRPLKTKEIKHIIDELHTIGTVLLIFSGGEAFLRKDFAELIEYAYKKDFLISILTNGTLIGNREIKMLKKFRIVSIQVSIYSHIPAIHDSITNSKGSFAKSMEIVKQLINNKINVVIATPLMKINFPEYEGIRKMAKSIGVRHRYSWRIWERNNGSTDVHALRLSKEEIHRYLSEDLSRNIYSPRAKEELICGAGINTCTISSQGDLFPCTILNKKIGNLLRQRLDVLWNASVYLNKLRKLRIRNLKKCAKCPSLAYCRVCLGLNWRATRSLLRPAKISCDYAFCSRKAVENSERMIKQAGA